MKEYPIKGEKVSYVSDERMGAILGYMPKWKRKLIGGCVFVNTKEIYIRESRRGDKKLLAHERGHLLGFSHILFPSLMFPSWVGRLFNTYYPYKRGV